MKTEEGNISYEELKMSAQDRSRWSQRRWKPAMAEHCRERERERGREGERDINDMDSDLHSWILMFADGTKIQRSQG